MFPSNNVNNISCSRGQLGTGSLDDQTDPVLVEALVGLKITKISAGGWHSCAIGSIGDLYTWGWNANGQLGLSKSDQIDKAYNVQATPHLVESFSTDLNVIKIASGNRHTIVLLGWCSYFIFTVKLKIFYHFFILQVLSIDYSWLHKFVYLYKCIEN